MYNRSCSKTKTAIMPKTRSCVNVTVFLVTNLMILVTINLTDADCFAVKIFSDTMINFDDSFRSVVPNYTDYVDHYSYLSGSITFNPKAMAGYYQLTKHFLDAVLDPNFIDERMIKWSDNNYPLLSDSFSINQFLKDNWVFLLILSILLLISLLVPIGGFVFCCCRCCGNCGAKADPSDKKRDFYNKLFQGSLMIALFALLLIGVVGAFASNQQMRYGVDEFPDNIRKSYADSMKYLDSANDQAENILITNFNEFSDVFNNTIQNSGNNIMQQMAIWNKASAMYELANFVEALSEIKSDLRKLNQYTDKLKTTSADAKTELDILQTNLINTLKDCGFPQCTSTMEQIKSLKINIDFSQIPDVTSAIDALNTLDEVALQRAVDDGKTNLDNIIIRIDDILIDIIQTVSKEIKNAGTLIQQFSSNMTNTVRDIQIEINNINKTMEEGYSYISDYSPYFYYVGLTLCCILLLVPLCIGFGLIFGTCGKRPEMYRPNSLNKETGSTFLISAAFIIFICTIIIGLLTMVMLISGLLVDRVICYSLRNPNQSSIIQILDDYVIKNNHLDFDFRPSSILIRCGNNDSIYQVLDLSNRFNIENLIEDFNVNGTLDEIMSTISSQINDIIGTDFTILNESNMDILKDLQNINPNIDFDIFQSQLNQNVTNINLDSLIQSLEEIVELFEANNAYRVQLESDIQQVKTYDEKHLQPMVVQGQEILDLAAIINTELKLNSTSFEEGIKKLIKEVNVAQTELLENKNQLVDAAKLFGNIVKEQVESYLQRVIRVMTNELGQCGPLSVAFNATLIASCDKILLPWNGFWFSLFGILLIFIPTIIVLISLASLYKKYKINKQYMGGQRFRVDKKQKKVKMNNVRYPNSEQKKRESRYDDMAPKNWELLHLEGSPVYQRTLFEYERPPPYYYPGFFEQ